MESPVWTPMGSKVLDGADDDAVAGDVAHDLHLDLLPALDGLLHQDLAVSGTASRPCSHDGAADRRGRSAMPPPAPPRVKDGRMTARVAQLVDDGLARPRWSRR